MGRGRQRTTPAPALSGGRRRRVMGCFGVAGKLKIGVADRVRAMPTRVVKVKERHHVEISRCVVWGASVTGPRYREDAPHVKDLPSLLR